MGSSTIASSAVRSSGRQPATVSISEIAKCRHAGGGRDTEAFPMLRADPPREQSDAHPQRGGTFDQGNHGCDGPVRDWPGESWWLSVPGLGGADIARETRNETRWSPRSHRGARQGDRRGGTIVVATKTLGQAPAKTRTGNDRSRGSLGTSDASADALGERWLCENPALAAVV